MEPAQIRLSWAIVGLWKVFSFAEAFDYLNSRMMKRNSFIGSE